MENQKKTNQEICDLIKSDIRVVAAVQKVEENEDNTLQAWVEITKKNQWGFRSRDATGNDSVGKRNLQTQGTGFKCMREVFEENKASYGLPEDAGFFDVFMHPCHDKELTRVIGNLIKIYEKIYSYNPKFKKLAKKMKDVGLEYLNFNGAVIVTAAKPEDIALLEEEEKLKIDLTTQFAEIERIKIGIELWSLVFRETAKWFLELLRTFPTTKITKELIAYFESLKKCSANVRLHPLLLKS